MPQEHTKEEFWKLFGKLPEELKDAIFSGETADRIRSICERYNIGGKNVPEIASQTGNVLLGLLPPNDFQNILEIDLKLEKETAEKVAREINRFIFYPVKPELEQLYGAEKTIDGDASTERIEQKQNKMEGEDRYREVVE